MNKTVIKDWFRFFAPRFLCLALVLGLLVRIVLILHPVTTVDWGFADWMKIIFLGFLNDVFFSAFALVPAFLVYSFFSDFFFKKPAGYIVFGLWAALTLYVFLFNDITDEYGGPLPRIVKAVLTLILVCYGIKLFVPAVRATWHKVAVYILMMLYASLSVTIAFSEVVFWEEFGVRFNFIAVDYLIYTNEVVGNIMESYPIVPMFLGVFVVAAIICALMVRGKKLAGAGVGSLRSWLINLCCLAAACFAGYFWLHNDFRNWGSTNQFATQIHQNGCWDFLEAFASNELNYEQFYAVIPDEEADAMQKQMCNMNADGITPVRDDNQPIRKNIVLVTVESLSADFLTRYGQEADITPCLDTIMNKGLVFDNLFATGNRTVRGLEAVTLCIPPSAGASLVKRPDNLDFFSTGALLEGMGYSPIFIYGGDSYFDNMGAFFRKCGYEIWDKKMYDASAISFSNIWGTADEDSYREAIGLLDKAWEAGSTVFAHIMTISNHRPYTYPEGRIEYDGNAMSRKAAVKYTDWAIGKFISDASSRPWFKETVFVIVADHCASSAGKTSVPLDGYHIPAVIYAPGFIEPAAVDKVCSQIDIMPTLFSLLHLSYDSRFYGADILSPDYKERAFVATYQDLGYYADGILTVLSPVRSVRQFKVSRDQDGGFKESLMEEEEPVTLKEAQAFYQAVNKMY